MKARNAYLILDVSSQSPMDRNISRYFLFSTLKNTGMKVGRKYSYADSQKSS
jgi:hypothetical protein